MMLNDYLRQEYGAKLLKIPIDAGFTCPNRDGHKGYLGCTFCSEQGSGEFAVKNDFSFVQSLSTKKTELIKKWGQDHKYITVAYFQSYTNTYAPLSELRRKFETVLDTGLFDGIVVATRPDCIDQDIAQFLSKQKVLWVELGLQSVSDEVLKRENTCYTYKDFQNALRILSEHNIKTVVHMIAGFEKDDFIGGITQLFSQKPYPWGIKLAMLNIIKNTQIAQRYNDSPWHLYSMEEYIMLIRKALAIIPNDVVIHRLTGDAKHDDLIAPQWIKNKKAVLAGIFKKK